MKEKRKYKAEETACVVFPLAIEVSSDCMVSLMAIFIVFRQQPHKYCYYVLSLCGHDEWLTLKMLSLIKNCSVCKYRFRVVDKTPSLF